MKMTGEEVIAAPRQAVWNALNDPEILKQCITGCEEVKKKSDKEFEAKVTAKVGPVKATFVGDVKLSKLNPPRSYVISGEGKGGVAGFAKGGATIRLSDTGDAATKLSYDVDAQVGGKLAQIGSRLIDSTARKMATDFFKKFNRIVSQNAEDTEMTKKTPAKKASAKKPAAKAAKTAAKPAVKAAATRSAGAGTTAKPAAKAAKASTRSAAKSKPAAKTAKVAARPAAKSKPAAKASSKTAAKSRPASVAAASKTVASMNKSVGATVGAVESAAVKVVSDGSETVKKATAETAAAVKSSASGAGQKLEAVKNNVSGNIPPQVKSMSRMWTWVMLAAAAGLVLLWAAK